MGVKSILSSDDVVGISAIIASSWKVPYTAEFTGQDSQIVLDTLLHMKPLKSRT
jgi:hypothetical protein